MSHREIPRQQESLFGRWFGVNGDLDKADLFFPLAPLCFSTHAHTLVILEVAALSFSLACVTFFGPRWSLLSLQRSNRSVQGMEHLEQHHGKKFRRQDTAVGVHAVVEPT